MKNIIFGLLIALVSSSLYGQSTSNLIVFSEEAIPFYLILNGVRQNENPETNIRVESLSQPYYTTKIIFNDETIEPIEKKMLMVMDADGANAEVTYKIKRDKKDRLKLKWFSGVSIKEAPAPPNNVTIVQYNTTPLPAITYTETTTTTTTTPTGGNSNSSTESLDVGINIGGVNLDMGVKIEESSGQSTEVRSSTHTTTTTTTTGDPSATPVNNPMPNYSGPIGCAAAPMTMYDFNGVKSSIASKTFEDDKLTVAKQVANANCLTAEQVTQITRLFEYEDTRLQFTKMAYARTYDIGDYYKVNDAFEYDSSIEELDAFIGN